MNIAAIDALLADSPAWLPASERGRQHDVIAPSGHPVMPRDEWVESFMADTL